MKQRVGLVGRIIKFDYVNYKGEASVRRIRVDDILFDSNEWHKEKQFLMYGYDYDKKAFRCFAMKDITNVLIDL